MFEYCAHLDFLFRFINKIFVMQQSETTSIEYESSSVTINHNFSENKINKV